MHNTDGVKAIDFRSAGGGSRARDDTKRCSVNAGDRFRSIVDRIVTGAGRGGSFERAFGPGS
jgi:hypothetical protein